MLALSSTRPASARPFLQRPASARPFLARPALVQQIVIPESILADLFRVLIGKNLDENETDFYVTLERRQTCQKGGKGSTQQGGAIKISWFLKFFKRKPRQVAPLPSPAEPTTTFTPIEQFEVELVVAADPSPAQKLPFDIIETIYKNLGVDFVNKQIKLTLTNLQIDKSTIDNHHAINTALQDALNTSAQLSVLRDIKITEITFSSDVLSNIKTKLEHLQTQVNSIKNNNYDFNSDLMNKVNTRRSMYVEFKKILDNFVTDDNIESVSDSYTRAYANIFSPERILRSWAHQNSYLNFIKLVFMLSQDANTRNEITNFMINLSKAYPKDSIYLDPNDTPTLEIRNALNHISLFAKDPNIQDRFKNLTTYPFHWNPMYTRFLETFLKRENTGELTYIFLFEPKHINIMENQLVAGFLYSAAILLSDQNFSEYMTTSHFQYETFIQNIYEELQDIRISFRKMETYWDVYKFANKPVPIVPPMITRKNIDNIQTYIKECLGIDNKITFNMVNAYCYVYKLLYVTIPQKTNEWLKETLNELKEHYNGKICAHRFDMVFDELYWEITDKLPTQNITFSYLQPIMTCIPSDNEIDALVEGVIRTGTEELKDFFIGLVGAEKHLIKHIISNCPVIKLVKFPVRGRWPRRTYSLHPPPQNVLNFTEDILLPGLKNVLPPQQGPGGRGGGKPSSTTKLTKSGRYAMHNKRKHVVYIGKRGGEYIKTKNGYTNIKKLSAKHI
jgi:hypothetical protein